MASISVEYLDHHGSDSAIANAARISFISPEQWNEVPEGYTSEREAKLLSFLAKHKHTTPFRHNSITLRCKVPLFLARQLGKHQAGLSWNETSRRYTTADVKFWTCPNWRSQPTDGAKQGAGDSLPLAEQIAMRDIVEAHQQGCLNLYNYLLDEKQIAPELARTVLPQDMMVEYVWTGNLMAFAHVYNLRADGHAQEAAREFSGLLNEVLKPLFPQAWSALTNA